MGVDGKVTEDAKTALIIRGARPTGVGEEKYGKAPRKGSESHAVK